MPTLKGLRLYDFVEVMYSMFQNDAIDLKSVLIICYLFILLIIYQKHIISCICNTIYPSLRVKNSKFFR